MESTSRFAGFPEGTFRFLAGIAANNDRAWFTQHRDDYESFYIAPALAFIEAMGPRLQELRPDLRYEARVNGSLFRINRDIRFSKDKTPYKHHLDMWFWEGERKGWDSPGFFFRMFSESLIIGAGIHRFGPEQVAGYRTAVIDPNRGAELAAMVGEIEAMGVYHAGEKSRKTVPRGFDPDHERARFLLYEGLIGTLETGIPREAASADFLEFCLKHYTALSPINGWLRHNLK